MIVPRAGDVLLTGDDSRSSRFIRWWTASEWSHAALVLGALDPPLGFTALEVSPPAARIVDHTYYRDRRRLLLRPPISIEHGRRAATGALDVLGERYPWLSLAGFALVPTLRGWIRHRAERVCSAHVAGLLTAHAHLVWRDDVGLPLDPRSDVSPRTIAAQAERQGWEWREMEAEGPAADD